MNNSTNDQRQTFEQLRRGLLQTVAPIQKLWPDSPFRLEVTLTKRAAPSSTSNQ